MKILERFFDNRAAGIFISLLLLHWIYWAHSYVALPDPLAIKFDASGAANYWVSPTQYLLIQVLISLVSPIIVLLLLHLSNHFPSMLLNIHRSQYWLAMENRAQMRAIVSRYAFSLAGLMVMFGTAIHFAILKANSIEPAFFPSRYTYVLICLFFMGVFMWSRMLNRALSVSST